MPLRDRKAVSAFSYIPHPRPVRYKLPKQPDKFMTAGALVAASNVLHTRISVDWFRH